MEIEPIPCVYGPPPVIKDKLPTKDNKKKRIKLIILILLIIIFTMLGYFLIF